MDAKLAETLVIAVAQTRDREAFARLFIHYAPRLKGFIIKRGVDVTVADELVQEIMAAVWTKARYFDAARGNANTWLFTIARNALVDRVRRERRPELDPNDPSLVPPAPAELDSQLESARYSEQLKMAIQTLSAEQSHVIVEVYGKGKSLAEIAAQSHTPLGTIKTRLRLALARLRSTLQSKP